MLFLSTDEPKIIGLYLLNAGHKQVHISVSIIVFNLFEEVTTPTFQVYQLQYMYNNKLILFNRSLGFLKCNLKVTSSVLCEKVYMGFVHPQIEYGAAIWDPRPGVENDGAHKIEMVQRL